MTGSTATAGVWEEAVLAAALLAIDPAGIGGVCLRAPAGPVRDEWLTLLRELLPAAAPLRRIPLHVNDARLLGGLDLAATLRAGRPIAERGLLVEADGGVVVLAMAERLELSIAARLAAVLDTGEVALERDGVASRTPTNLGMVALDEGLEPDEKPPAALLDRLGIHLDLQALVAVDDEAPAPPHRADIVAARARLPGIDIADDLVQAICAAAQALGIVSMRAPLLALRVARAMAALDGRDMVEVGDAAVAARLVLAPRASQVPTAETMPDDAQPDTEQPDQQEPPDSEAAPPEDPSAAEPDADTPTQDVSQTDDVILDAARAAIPAGLLAALIAGQGAGGKTAAGGRAGAQQQGRLRGRPIGSRRGDPRAGVRLDVIETLRAAAPWQKLRRRERGEPEPTAGEAGGHQRVQIRRDDFHVTRFRQRSETTTIFAVDASGSAALHRLGEAKGAVELLLADCYVRRDRVALIAFRGRAAELLLPPTRSLVRAKRSLAGLPGGGGTPLAAGIDAAFELADAIRRRGATPVVVVLTDGRANVGRDGVGGREQASADAMAAARRARAGRLTALVLDTSPQAQRQARELAAEMGATYLPLPYAGAAAVSQAVRMATVSAGAT